MLHRIFAYWGVALLLITCSQCDQCKYQPVENISQWELVWEQAEPFKHSLPGVDLQKGITCHVPSEAAVYYLNPTGECWRFTQSSEEGLTYEKIASFPRITGQQTFFAFSAGSTQAQTLHVGMLDQQHVTLTQYKEGAWELVRSYTLDLEAMRFRARGAACAIHEGTDQLNGLIVLKPQAARQPPVILVYNAATKALVPGDKWELQSKITPSTATEIAPGIVLLGRQQFKEAVFYLSKGGTSKGKLFDAPATTERLSLFVLKARALMKKAILVLYIKKDEKTDLKFYTLERGAERREMQPSHNLPEKLEKGDKEGAEAVDDRIDHSKSLVIPFADAVYVVTQDKDGRLVYYRGSIQAPSKRVEEEAEQDDPKAKKNKK